MTGEVIWVKRRWLLVADLIGLCSWLVGPRAAERRAGAPFRRMEPVRLALAVHRRRDAREARRTVA